MSTAVLGYLGQAVPDAPGIFVPERPHSHTPVGAGVSTGAGAPATQRAATEA